MLFLTMLFLVRLYSYICFSSGSCHRSENRFFEIDSVNCVFNQIIGRYLEFYRRVTRCESHIEHLQRDDVEKSVQRNLDPDPEI